MWCICIAINTTLMHISLSLSLSLLLLLLLLHLLLLLLLLLPFPPPPSLSPSSPSSPSPNLPLHFSILQPILCLPPVPGHNVLPQPLSLGVVIWLVGLVRSVTFMTLCFHGDLVAWERVGRVSTVTIVCTGKARTCTSTLMSHKSQIH